MTHPTCSRRSSTTLRASWSCTNRLPRRRRPSCSIRWCAFITSTNQTNQHNLNIIGFLSLICSTSKSASAIRRTISPAASLPSRTPGKKAPASVSSSTSESLDRRSFKNVCFRPENHHPRVTNHSPMHIWVLKRGFDIAWQFVATAYVSGGNKSLISFSNVAKVVSCRWNRSGKRSRTVLVRDTDGECQGIVEVSASSLFYNFFICLFLYSLQIHNFICFFMITPDFILFDSDFQICV